MKLPRFSVHPFAAAGIFLLLFAVPRTQSVAFVTVTVMHELGHGTAALLLGKRMEKITLMPVGISMKISAAASYAEEIFIAFAGPFENILLIILSPLFPQSGFIRLFSQITLALNLLPMATLDGGRILSAVVSLSFCVCVFVRTVKFSASFSLFFLWTVAVYILLYAV